MNAEVVRTEYTPRECTSVTSALVSLGVDFVFRHFEVCSANTQNNMKSITYQESRYIKKTVRRVRSAIESVPSLHGCPPEVLKVGTS